MSIEPFAQYANLPIEEIYPTLHQLWNTSAIGFSHRVCERSYGAPIVGSDAQIGAGVFLALLAYPERSSEKKRNELLRAITADRVKRTAPPQSLIRKEIRNDPTLSWALDIPNKRIRQQLKVFEGRMYTRQRAATVALKKLVSDPNPTKQANIFSVIPDVAAWNFEGRAFFSTDPIKSEKNISDSFRRQILSPTKPVLHMAMAFFIRFNGTEPQHPANLLASAEGWLKETVIAAEVFRVIFRDLFPTKRTPGLPSKRTNNIEVRIEDTIAMFPHLAPIPPGQDWQNFLIPIELPT